MLRTADVDVNPEEMVESVDADAGLALATIAACGSSFCSSAAADAAATSAADAATTAVCGSSFCSSAAAEWGMDADAAAVSTADANYENHRIRGIHFPVSRGKGGGVYHSVLFIL